MRRSAFTLFEVILALAILVGTMAVLGELVRGGLISAQRARDLSRATLICEGKVAQIVAGIQAPDPVASAMLRTTLPGNGSTAWKSARRRPPIFCRFESPCSACARGQTTGVMFVGAMDQVAGFRNVKHFVDR